MPRNMNHEDNQAPVQQEIFKTLLRTPHRAVDETICIHREQYDRDPNFYAKLAVHAAMRGGCTVRDVNEVFIANLFTSEFQEHREAAYVMLQNLPPYEVTRVMNMVTGWTDSAVRHYSYDAPKDVRFPRQFGLHIEPEHHSKRHHNESLRGKVIQPKRVRIGRKMRDKLTRAGKVKSSDSHFTVETIRVRHEGFGKKNVTGLLKCAVDSYLRYREQNETMMVGALLRAKNHIKQMYRRSHRLAGGSDDHWISRYLFHREVQEGTRLAALRELSESEDPTRQAEIIVEHKLPYPVVVSTLKTITPSVIVAIIDSMTTQELMSNMGQLSRRGATKHPEVKALIEKKLKGATKKKTRVDAMKGAFGAQQVEGLDDDLSEIMTEVTDAQLKFHGKITAKTALLIDKSASMSEAIELSRQIGATLAQACDELRVFTFDYNPVEIRIRGDKTTKSAWDDALKMVRAGGGTEPDKVIEKMIREKIEVDQLLVITDEGENCEGAFASTVKRYEQAMGFCPAVVIVRIGGSRWCVSDRMAKTCKRQGITTDVLVCQSIDKIAIPNLLQLLSRKSIFDLIQEILSIDLPTREEWDKKHLKPDSTVESESISV